MLQNEDQKVQLRKGVFYPTFLVMVTAIIVGVFKNEWLKAVCKTIFKFSLLNFGWLYQIAAMTCFVLVAAATFSKLGNIRIGGKEAKAKYPFHT